MLLYLLPLMAEQCEHPIGCFMPLRLAADASTAHLGRGTPVFDAITFSLQDSAIFFPLFQFGAHRPLDMASCVLSAYVPSNK